MTGVLQNEVDMAVGNAVGVCDGQPGADSLGFPWCASLRLSISSSFAWKALLMAASALLLFLLCRGGRLTVGPSL